MGYARAWARGQGLQRVLLGVLLLTLAVLGSAPGPAQAAPAAPTITGPRNGLILTTFAPTLSWTNPPGVTQYQLQVRPFRDDGPALDLHLGVVSNTFTLPPPPQWYGLLPDVTYTWRVRVSDSPAFADLADRSWSPWAGGAFRTPAVYADTLSPLSPMVDEMVTTRTPTLLWANTRSDVFFYEFQLSRDYRFETNPRSATAAVTTLLLHGGVTRPIDSYTVPPDQPLDDAATYYWRLRPRVQGDGTPVDWSPTFSFRVNSRGTASLNIGNISFSARAGTGECTVPDATDRFTADPLLSSVAYGYGYGGAGTVAHLWYADGTELTRGRLTLPSTATCRLGTVELAQWLPAAPGRYWLEVWVGGQVARSGSFVIQPPPSVAIGPISFGFGIPLTANCALSGAQTSFPVGVPFIYFRWNTVGEGLYYVTLQRDGVVVASDVLRARNQVGCDYGSVAAPDRAEWRVEISIAGRVLQAASARVQ